MSMAARQQKSSATKRISDSFLTSVLVLLGLAGSPLLAVIARLYSSKANEATGQFSPYIVFALLLLFVVAVGIFIVWRVYGLARSYFIMLYHVPDNTQIFQLFFSRLFRLPPTSPTADSSRFLVVHNGKLRNENDPVTWLGGPKLMVVLDGSALYIERGNQFSRVIGPGIEPLDKYEIVKKVVDLRPQQFCPPGQNGSEYNINAWTKDGVRVECTATITCQIGEKIDGLGATETQINPDADLEELRAQLKTTLFPCDQDKVRKAVEWTKVKQIEARGKEEFPECEWLPCTWGKVQGFLANYIARQRLDDLFIGSDKQSKKHALSAKQREEIQIRLNDELLKDAGVSLLDLQISNLHVRPEIHQKNVEIWEAKQKRWQKIKQAEIEAEKTKNIAIKKAAAQRDLIKEITEELNRASQKGVDVNTLLMAVSKEIHQGLQSPAFQQYLQQELAQQLREILNRK